MLEHYASDWALVIQTLGSMERWWEQSYGMGRLMTGGTDQDAELRQIRLEHSIKALEAVEQSCGFLGLTGSRKAAKRLAASISAPILSKLPTNDFRRDFEALRDRVIEDLGEEFFLHVRRQDAAHYGQAAGFGAEVAHCFPRATLDIESAGSCLALGQPTACVFHLMRVMEIGVQALAKKLQVRTIDPRVETWNKIVEHINVALNSLPTKTLAQQRKKADLGGATAYLNSARVAWRNEVMHPKKSYTLDEARSVFNATHAFMAHLASLVR